MLNSREQERHEVRFGFDVGKQIFESTFLIAMAEGVHRFNHRTSAISGQLIGLFGFGFQTPDDKETWMRGGFEVEQRMSDMAMISASIHASTQGEDPTVSGGVKLKVTF
jgi:hypothetical protein